MITGVFGSGKRSNSIGGVYVRRELPTADNSLYVTVVQEMRKFYLSGPYSDVSMVYNI